MLSSSDQPDLVSTPSDPSKSVAELPAGFGLTVGNGLALMLRTPHLSARMFALQSADQPRLAQWEQWAVDGMSEQSVRAGDQAALAGFAAGKVIPTCICWKGVIVGAASARLDDWSESAELGYFIASDHEGLGLVTRSVRALIDYVAEVHAVKRCYIQAAVDNTRSLAVADRLGFRREGVLRSAWSVGQQPRVDAAIYGLPMTERPWVQPADQAFTTG